MITCKKCGSVDDYSTEQKGNNLVATCNTCNSYIQNIPYDKPKMYVGKYKGRAISDIEDIPYLKWAHENMTTLSAHNRNAVKEQIHRLEMLLK